MQELSGKTVVITGAGSGIGFAMAEAFGRAGARLFLADIDGRALQQAIDQLSPITQAAGEVADVTRSEDVARLADRAYAQYGAVHILCNNAGILPPVRPTWEMTLEDWTRTMQINTFGVIYGTHHFLPRMMAQNEPAWVVNTASLAGLISAPFSAPYYASKHAVVALSECLHFELASQKSPIKVLIVCPSWAKTKLADLPPEAEAHTPAAQQREQAIRRMVQESAPPSEIARQVLEAIRDGRLYLFTHPERKSDVAARFEDILEERQPHFPRRPI